MFSCPVIACTGNNVVDQIVVTDAGPPLVKRVAALETDIIHGEGDQFLFCDLIGVFIIFIHCVPPYAYGRCFDFIKFIIGERAEICNIFTYSLYIFGYTFEKRWGKM